jgi:hypothetical protein
LERLEVEVVSSSGGDAALGDDDAALGYDDAALGGSGSSAVELKFQFQALQVLLTINMQKIQLLALHK